MSRQQHIIDICLIGTASDVTFWLDLLDDLATITDLTTPYQRPDGQICIRVTVSRSVPLTGGPR